MSRKLNLSVTDINEVRSQLGYETHVMKPKSSKAPAPKKEKVNLLLELRLQNF